MSFPAPVTALPQLTSAIFFADSAVLGISSLVNAFPYEVPSFIPNILLETAMKHSASPVPISTTIRSTLSNFKRSHTDRLVKVPPPSPHAADRCSFTS